MAALWMRIHTLLLALVLLALLGVIAMLATGVRGGPLDPPGPPGSTMKTLDEIPGSWSRTLPANDGEPGPFPPAGCNSSRFTCVLDYSGVLDLETGLVWERMVGTSSVPWANAEGTCGATFTGGRSGWRLPTVEELRSLLDPNASSAPFLPEGHPFQNPSPDAGYWTATTLSTETRMVRVVYLDLGGGAGWKQSSDPVDWYRYWCVRGGQGFNGM